MGRTHWTVLLAVVALSVGAVNAAAGQFKHAVYSKAGSRPYQVVAAHLTNSGNLDLAVADYLGGQVSILLGNGDGTFQTPRKFAVPAPFAMAIGDLDGDGNPDLAVVESEGNSTGALHLFLGDGTGNFHAGTSYRLGTEPTSVAMADFDADGHLDLAVVNNGGQSGKGSLMVFIGTGKGTLKKPITYKIAGAPWGIAAGDLNSDYTPDLAVTNLGGYVSIFLNDGTGHFLKPVPYAWNGSPVDVKIADLRNDGKQDLVVADGAEGMVVLLNNGDSTFGKATIYPPTCQNCVAPEACVVADFNLDGHLDVACATSIDDSYLFYGDGKGKFGGSIPIHDAINFQGGFSIAAGDFITGDNAPDLAIPIEIKGKVAILLNNQ